MARRQRRKIKVMARNIRKGDRFEGQLVTLVRITEKGNASIQLKDGSWRRRPVAEKVPVERL